MPEDQCMLAVDHRNSFSQNSVRPWKVVKMDLNPEDFQRGLACRMLRSNLDSSSEVSSERFEPFLPWKLFCKKKL